MPVRMIRGASEQMQCRLTWGGGGEGWDEAGCEGRGLWMLLFYGGMMQRQKWRQKEEEEE